MGRASLSRFTLCAHLARGKAERWAFAGLILTVAGLVAAVIWIASDSVVSGLSLEGQRTFLEQRYDSLIWLNIFSILTNIFIFNIRLILFGIVIRRSQTLPQGAKILWIASVVVAGMKIWRGYSRGV